MIIARYRPKLAGKESVDLLPGRMSYIRFTPVLQTTAQYITDFKATAASAKSADDLAASMKSKYPNLKLPAILQLSAQSALAK